MELTASERRVLDAARTTAAALAPGDVHTVAAAAMDLSGRIHTGVNVHHFTGGPCAEIVALGVAASAPDPQPLVTIAAVVRTGELLVPCGKCRQVFTDLHPGVFVIVPGTREPQLVPLHELLPRAYHQPGEHPGRLLRFASRYYDEIAAGTKTVTIRYRDPIETGPVTLVFEDDDGYRSLPAHVDTVAARRIDPGADAELLAGLRQHYPGIPDNAAVEVVNFRVL